MAFFVAGKNVLMIVITKTTTKRLNWVSYGGHRHD